MLLQSAMLEALLSTVEKKPSQLILALQKIQEQYRYIPPESFGQIGEYLGVSTGQVMSVATFYNQFRLKPCGQHRIKVCIGTACHVAGAETIWEGFRQYLGIEKEEDTDKDEQFTIEKVACLGCCMMAPVVQVGQDIIGWVKPEQAKGILTDFLTKQECLANVKNTTDSLSYPNEMPLARIKTCLCSSCLAAGAQFVYEEIQQQIVGMQLLAYLQPVACLGVSYHSPVVEIEFPESNGKDGKHFFYGNIQLHQVRSMLLQHLRPLGIAKKLQVQWKTWMEYIALGSSTKKIIENQISIPEIGKKIALEGAGELDPLHWKDYQEKGGFDAFHQCLQKNDPNATIEVIVQSGLRGRGGAGFPTGQKWKAVQQAISPIKYIIANGDEGDPGAFMDRMILESFPLRVLEGMMIAGWCVGAKRGILYIRSEYPLAVQRIQRAIEICRQQGYLGKNFDLEVFIGAGAFVCGEETALLASLEGCAGRPHYRPPYPSSKGLYGCPTLINNVETYSLVPWILRHGADQFASIGTVQSRGTKTFALAGKIVRGGLVEIPMGMTIREVVENIGGGVRPGYQFKAIQIGGPSGGCIPASMSDISIDYEELRKYGTMMGSGGMVVLDNSDCMVDISRYFLAFTQSESCGKCTFCRIGTNKMLKILEKICQKKGEIKDLEELERLARVVSQASLCGLGKSCSNPILSTLQYFREEYVAHIQGKCLAKRCSMLIEYQITPSRCIGCTKCFQQCVFQAIEGQAYQVHKIDREKCTRCDRCRQICPQRAIEVV